MYNLPYNFYNKISQDTPEMNFHVMNAAQSLQTSRLVLCAMQES